MNQFNSIVLNEAVALYLDATQFANQMWISHEDVCRYLLAGAIVAAGIYVYVKLELMFTQ